MTEDQTAGTSLPVLHEPAGDREAAKVFFARAALKTHDLHHRRVIRRATGTHGVAVGKAKLRFVDYEQARRRAAHIRRDAVENLDRYLEQFESQFRKNGGQVHWAETAADARRIILDIAKRAGARQVVKSKSMATEEVLLNGALQAMGVEPVETDLGEFICQIRDEPPYHIVTPAMHLTKDEIAQTFHEKLHAPKTADAEELTMQARRHLRSRFVAAGMGITGGNFLVADVGMIAITENEGNARLSFSLPPIHVALVGIEKVIPRLEDLAVLWPMLAASGTGQHLTCYSNLIGGPRRAGEPDGPREFHVVLLDNGRSRLLADPEQREAAQCIRCGACLNVCPVFKNVGGHTYATTYQGPIGSVITPHLKDVEHWQHLAYASSLCGSCSEACPVLIDLHHHLLRNRRNAVQQGFSSRWERLAFRAWLWFMRTPRRYRTAGRIARAAEALLRPLGIENWSFLNPVRGWTRTRTLPRLARRSFKDWWGRERHPRPSSGC